MSVKILLFLWIENMLSDSLTVNINELFYMIFDNWVKII